MDPALVVAAFGAGSALIGFWAVARYPSFGPQRVGTALVAAIAAFVLQSPLLALMAPAVETVGPGGALLFVVLPSLTLLFWAAGCLVRSLVTLAAPYKP